MLCDCTVHNGWIDHNGLNINLCCFLGYHNFDCFKDCNGCKGTNSLNGHIFCNGASMAIYSVMAIMAVIPVMANMALMTKMNVLASTSIAVFDILVIL